MSIILRETDKYILWQTGERIRLGTKEKATPKSIRLPLHHAEYLMCLNDENLEVAAARDYGVGVVAKG